MHNIKKILRADFEKNPKTSLFRHFFRNFGKTGFFFKNRALSLFLPYNGLTSCAKAKKSLERFPRKTPNQLTNGTDFIGPYGLEAGGPIKAMFELNSLRPLRLQSRRKLSF